MSWINSLCPSTSTKEGYKQGAIPDVGFFTELTGSKMPPRVCFSSSATFTSTRSPLGLSCNIAHCTWLETWVAVAMWAASVPSVHRFLLPTVCNTLVTHKPACIVQALAQPQHAHARSDGLSGEHFSDLSTACWLAATACCIFFCKIYGINQKQLFVNL
jgi:hypothetical protein